jgi:1-acyl-sn-glycerol-3-phosphate acyltransferase
MLLFGGNVLIRIRTSKREPFARHPDDNPQGFDPHHWKMVKPFFRFLFHRYWRVTCLGIENIPTQGPALLVSNHSGTLPYDAAMIKLAIEEQHPAGRTVRFLAEDFIFRLPFFGTEVARIGGLRANPDNAKKLIQCGELVLVFPEGIKGIGKRFRERYRLKRFGRGGFVRLAMENNCPLIPVAVLGAEEIHPILMRLTWPARSLGLPYLPITPTFPLLGPLGLIPLPSKWTIAFGAPMFFNKASKESVRDPLTLGDHSESVRLTIQKMIDELRAGRDSVF